MPDSVPNPRLAVVLTALPVEYLAVRRHLSDLSEEVHPRGTVYERGRFIASSGDRWDIGIAEIGAGNPSAAFEAERAIAHFDPAVVLFVGVAGGLKDVSIGDVVAATKVYGYESGKSKDAFETRPDVGLTTYRIEQRARAEARRSDWLVRIGAEKPVVVPRVFVGPIAAGEKVIGSTRSSIFEFLRTSYGDALAVEMEGRGFLAAARANQEIDALVIRGVSDLIDAKDGAETTGSQERAAAHASAFGFEILSKFIPQSIRRPVGDPEQELELKFVSLVNMYRKGKGNTWNPDFGSKDKKDADEMVRRGWLVAQVGGGYRITSAFPPRIAPEVNERVQRFGLRKLIAELEFNSARLKQLAYATAPSLSNSAKQEAEEIELLLPDDAQEELDTVYRNIETHNASTTASRM